MDQMDSVTSAFAALSLTSKSTIGNGRIAWPDGPATKQFFSLPDNIIYYMTRNPKSPESYLNLGMSCKYFFEKYPLLIVARIHEDGKKICSSADEDECYQKGYKCCVNVDLNKITKSKIWLTKGLDLIDADIPKIASILLPKLFQCENAFLILMCNEMTLEELKLWSLTFQKIIISIDIFDNDGNEVMLDSILEAIRNVKSLVFWFDEQSPAATTETLKNIANLKTFKNLEYLCLNEIPEDINVEDLAAFIMKHKNTKFDLDFQWNISAEFKIQLASLVDTVILSGIPNRLIRYCDQDQEKYKIMKSRFTY